MAVDIVNNDFSDIMFDRHATKVLDRNFKIPRDEILEMIAQATTAPSAVDSQPWRFIVVDTDEGKQKLESFMWAADRGRIEGSSASAIIMADTGWPEYIDTIFLRNRAEYNWSDEYLQLFRKVTSEWVMGLTKEELELSVTFQAGLVSMQLMLVARAHGYETGPMDAFTKEGLAKAFGLDEDRYKPVLVIGIGKGEGFASTSRRAPQDVTDFA
jgi:nitroreductase